MERPQVRGEGGPLRPAPSRPGPPISVSIYYGRFAVRAAEGSSVGSFSASRADVEAARQFPLPTEQRRFILRGLSWAGAGGFGGIMARSDAGSLCNGRHRWARIRKQQHGALIGGPQPD